jgi:hypothetical protein
MASDDSADHYVVLQRKVQLFPAITAAACRLRRLPVRRERGAVDPTPAFDGIEDAVAQLAFFCDGELTAALERLLGAALAQVETTRAIQKSSRPGFGGKLDEVRRGEPAKGSASK